MSPVARRLLIAVVVLAALLVGADRLGVYIAERTAGDTIETSQHLTSRPDVDIAGFPFLTQLAAGKFDEITITAADLPVGERLHLLDVSRVRVVLHTVRVSRDFSRVEADSATATATVSYAELGKTLGVHVEYADNGRIKATKTVTVAGQKFTASVTSRPELADGALSFGAAQINDGAQVGGAVASALNHVFDLKIPLQGIPFKIRVTALHAERSGVVVQLLGRNLSYSKS
jgi:DUF2993 family protein